MKWRRDATIASRSGSAAGRSIRTPVFGLMPSAAYALAGQPGAPPACTTTGSVSAASSAKHAARVGLPWRAPALALQPAVQSLDLAQQPQALPVQRAPNAAQGVGLRLQGASLTPEQGLQGDPCSFCIGRLILEGMKIAHHAAAFRLLEVSQLLLRAAHAEMPTQVSLFDLHSLLVERQGLVIGAHALV